MKQLRKSLTYANVMSTIAVFLVIGGASAFAAVQLGKNTVGSKQLKKNAVTTAKIKKEAVAGGKIKNFAVGNSKLGAGAVTSDKLADGGVTNGKLANGAVTNGKLAADSVTGDKVKDGSLSGSDINQSSLGGVKAANVYATTFESTGSKVVDASDPGVTSGGCFLACRINFPRDVSTCSATASSADAGNGSGEPAMAEVFHTNDGEGFFVVMWNDEGNLISHDFAITVVCPSAT